ncbi:hypothetical protein AZF37_08070 [endosymbiont 'TC1' of Trimyema compressum]|uniref:hypothetical protein n=1 Tax=endosymbiont 'TC1' of Trimyema compressum TaxID=243899 RepID=UPI0007F0EEB4|nr:hypothetical protein [endosymbiont 'TC1' of Trimyema compressum]AMP21119.1 hypothetical protein AZF37_08070 [endosymbiont 'TC1' of Trimyema compressum]
MDCFIIIFPNLGSFLLLSAVLNESGKETKEKTTNKGEAIAVSVGEVVKNIKVRGNLIPAQEEDILTSQGAIIQELFL